jgi:hypothetical protein
MLTYAAIIHCVMEFNIGVSGDGDLVLFDGEVLVLGARNAWSRRGINLALDDFSAKGTLAQWVTFAKAIGTLEAREREAIVGREAAELEVSPAVALFLLIAALVVVGDGCLER